MKEVTKQVLTALTTSPNKATAHNARLILAGGKVEFSPRNIEELASEGILGGFLEAVMGGDQREIWCRADDLNKTALVGVIDRATRNGADAMEDL